MADFLTIGKQFVEHYYTTFDTNRINLYTLYSDTSMLTFEGEQFQGAGNIQQKLISLPFQQCKHDITTIDSQPSHSPGGIVVFVSGSLKLPEQDHPLRFSQVCSLIPLCKSFYSFIIILGVVELYDTTLMILLSYFLLLSIMDVIRFA